MRHAATFAWICPPVHSSVFLRLLWRKLPQCWRVRSAARRNFAEKKFFVLLEKDWSLEAPLLAEGLRKLGSIAHLIRNGSLTEKSVLFWDEPEANINPKLIVMVAKTLLGLAGEGVRCLLPHMIFS